MRFYNQRRKFYCSIDLHARKMYVRIIDAQGKTKNDKIDSYKIAKLLMGGNMPVAYPYPAKMRATRDLLRRRTYLLRQRGLLLAHIQNTNT